MSARAVILSFFFVAVASRAAETSLVVGDGWALARQRATFAFTNTTQEFSLDFLPPETDPLSLVFASAGGLEVQSWRKPADKGIVATLAAGSPRDISADVSYIVRGPAWRASYQLIVRADPSREEEPASVDIEGRITVQNASGGVWSNAALRVVGADRRPGIATKEPGFLELDEASPLSDLWAPAASDEGPAFSCDLGRAVTIRAHEERSFTLVSIERKTAGRRYLLTSDDVALDGREPGRPLRRCLVLPNDEAHGLGRDLPGGAAQIFLGSVRATLGGGAWFERTPAGGEIRIELGPSDRVLGLRRSAGREPGTPGQVEENYEIEIRNGLDSAAIVEIVEQPPVRQSWVLVRTSQPAEIRARRLHYRLEIPARDRFTVRYTVRMPVQKI